MHLIPNQVYYHSSRDMHEIPDDTVHLAFTSPPYFNIKDYFLDGAQSSQHSEPHPEDSGNVDEYAAYIDALVETWRECARVLVPNGKLVVNAPLMPLPKSKSKRHNRTMLNLYADIEHSIVNGDFGMHLMDMYIWNRTNSSKPLMFGSYPYPSNFYAQNNVEFLGVFVKEGTPQKADPVIKEKSRLSQDEWIEYTRQVWDIGVIYNRDIGYAEHSAIMPEELAKRCIRLFTYVGDIVLDPFTGSGTTLKVAKELDRNYIGYEIYDHYKHIINRRLRLAGIKQARLLGL